MIDTLVEYLNSPYLLEHPFRQHPTRWLLRWVDHATFKIAAPWFYVLFLIDLFQSDVADDIFKNSNCIVIVWWIVYWFDMAVVKNGYLQKKMDSWNQQICGSFGVLILIHMIYGIRCAYFRCSWADSPCCKQLAFEVWIDVFFCVFSNVAIYI